MAKVDNGNCDLRAAVPVRKSRAKKNYSVPLDFPLSRAYNNSAQTTGDRTMETLLAVVAIVVMGALVSLLAKDVLGW